MRAGPDSDVVLLAHILQCLGRIQEYTEDGREAFFESTLVQDAVVRNLQTLAESTQRLSDKIKATKPEVSWPEIAGFRNAVVHDYLAIDLEAVWSVVELDLGPLGEAVEAMQQALSEGGNGVADA